MEDLAEALESRPVDIRALAKMATTKWAQAALDRKVELVYTQDDRVPPAVMADKFRMKQAMSNLIGVGIQLAPDGGNCTVLFELVKTNDDAKGERVHTIRFSVKDDGKGFTDEERSNIFKPFSHLTPGGLVSQSNIGMNSFLAKRIVEKVSEGPPTPRISTSPPTTSPIDSHHSR